MHSTMILLSILFGLLTQAYTLPVKVSTKRTYFRANAPFSLVKLYYNAPLCYRILLECMKEK